MQITKWPKWHILVLFGCEQCISNQNNSFTSFCQQFIVLIFSIPCIYAARK